MAKECAHTNCLKDEACPVIVWLGKLTALDMTLLGWLVRKRFFFFVVVVVFFSIGPSMQNYAYFLIYFILNIAPFGWGRQCPQDLQKHAPTL